MILTEKSVKIIVHKSVSTLTAKELDQLPVTFYKRSDGQYKVLSCYHNSIWEYPTSRFPSSTSDSQRLLKFNILPKSFRASIKEIIRQYDCQEMPAGSTLVNFFSNLRLFLTYLSEMKVTRIAEINPMHCANYVNHCMQLKTHNRQHKASSLIHRFWAVEKLQSLARETSFSFPMPWPDNSAAHLAGITNRGTDRYKAKTLIIPDNQLTLLFQRAVNKIGKGEGLIELRDVIGDRQQELTQQGYSKSHINKLLAQQLSQLNYMHSIRSLNAELDILLDACMVVILTLSGIRVHELAYLRNNSWYKTVDDSGEVIYWM